MNQQQVLDALYRMRKDDFTAIGGHPVYCTGNTIALTIDGVEIEYEYYGDAARSIMAMEHTAPIYGYAREML